MRCCSPNHKQARDMPQLRALQILPTTKIARRKKASLPENDHARSVDRKSSLVARAVTAMESPAPRAGRASLPGSHTADWRTSGTHGGGLHLGHRARWRATVPDRRSSVEKVAGSGGWFPGDGVFVIPVFPRRSG